MIRRHILVALLAAAPVFAALAEYPDKPITFVVPFAAGSGTDQLARALGQGVTDNTQQVVVVDNKPGANAFIGAQAAAHAPKDGYSVFITTNTTHAANEHLFKNLPYDPVKDFEPVTLLTRGGLILIVNNSLAANSIQDLVKLAKSKPGKLSLGYGSSSSRVAGELFKQMTGTYIVSIPYRSNPLAVIDVISGQIDMMITDMSTGLAQAKAGKVKPLGVSAVERTALAPELPTISEAGVKGYEIGFWVAAYVPAGTPASVVRRLNEILVKANKSQAISNYYARNGYETLTSTPDELRKFQAVESQKWRRVIGAAGIEKE